MRLCFVVNGLYESPMGIRARYFKKFLPKGFNEIIIYRNKNKIKAIFLFIRAIPSVKAEVVYVLDANYSGVIAAIAAKLTGHIKFILDVGDVGYELAKCIGRNPLALLLIWLTEQTALHTADTIVVRGSHHKRLLQQKGYKNVFLIPDGVDTEFSKPMDVSDLREELGLEGFLTIGVMGSTHWNSKLNWCYGLELIEVLKILRDYPVKAVFIGDGSGLPVLKERARNYGLEKKIVFTGWLDYSKIPRYINLFDVAISTQTNNLIGWVRTTGKLPEYLACGRYILATDVGEASLVLDNNMLIPYDGNKDNNYPHKLAHRIKNILADRKSLADGLKGIEITRRRFDYRVLCNTLQKVIAKE